MRDLSLHILDIAQNSIRAHASCIKITLEEDTIQNLFSVVIQDDGEGMDEEIKLQVTNPFMTTRRLRKVGLGVPFFKQICEECEGNLIIESKKGKGTLFKATMQYNHIDRLPLGDIQKTITTLIMAEPSLHYRYKHIYNGKYFCFDTEEVRRILDGVAIENLDILKWIEDYIGAQIEALR